MKTRHASQLITVITY